MRRRLERLKAWGTTTAYPFLLHLLDRREQREVTSEQITTAMLYVESFFVRRLIIGRATTNVNRILLSLVTEMSQDHPVDEAVRSYLSAGRKYYATDASVRDAVRSMPYYLNGRPHQRKLVLQWLEESFGNKEPVSPDLLTIEHVMPQALTPEWRQMLASDLRLDENLEEAYDVLVHTLGNLTLTGYNSELGNRSFAVKRVRLAKSGISLNQDIAGQERWGRREILARADSLAERIVSLWPGPTAQADNKPDVPWDIMNKALAELPAGSWTTYGDVAAIIGSHPVPVGVRLASHPAPNAHRVLQVDGAVSPSFRWYDADRADDPRDVLRSEGVEFDKHGRANPAQRVTIEELGQLAGLTPDDLPEQQPRAARETASGDRFLKQLTDLQSEEVAHAILSVLEAWKQLGGRLLYGSGDETSCFLMARDREHRLGNIWPAAVYPSGKFEIVFQHMSVREPFDDISLRDEFRHRLNQLPDVEIAASRIALRPGLPLAVLEDSKARDTLIEHLAWFYEQSQALTRDEVQ